MNSDLEEIYWPQKKRIIRTVDEKIRIDSSQSHLDTPISKNSLSAMESSAVVESAFSGVILPDGNEPIPLGSGVVKGMLGEGGMARVYRIWNEKLEVFRAVKLYHLIDRPELINRFEMEMKISANLCHPNIIQIHSSGEWNGLPFIEMELIEGVSLEKLIIQNTPFPVNVVLSIGIQIADALCYAHTKQIQLYGKTYHGLIHRDLKPANIMLSDNGVIKLLDFGIARPAEVGLNTISGNIVGTMPYLSPEQIDGNKIDQRSDIYSLGAVLYELLTGEKTFPQTTVMDLLKMKYKGEYRKFDTNSGNIPLKLTNIVEKCLNENKEKRFNSSLEFRNILIAYVNKTGIGSYSEVLKRFIMNPDCEKETVFRRKQIEKRLNFNTLYRVFGIVIFVFFSFQIFKDKKAVNHEQLAKSVSPVESFEVKTDMNVRGKKIVQLPLENKSNETQKRIDLSLVKKPQKEKYSGSNIKKMTYSQIESLRGKYRKVDLYEIADTACKISRFRDAIIALECIPHSHNSVKNGMILLTYAYLEVDSLEKAERISQKINSLDAFFCVIMGRLALARKNEMQALEIFQLALTRSSFMRSNYYVRCESVYYTALIYDNWFFANPSPENQQHAKIAWNNLKRIYSPDHERFKLAERKLSDL